jgi:hypothetical protein
MSEARQILDLNTSEKDFQAQIVELAQRTGWKVFHPYDMRRSAHGYPDLTMVHPERKLVIWAELKRENGKTTEAQDEWIQALMHATSSGGTDEEGARKIAVADVFVWRPSDWDRIERILRG